MKLKPTFYGQVENGKLTLSDKDQFKAYIGTLNGQVMITIDKRYKRRSSNENRYYWGIVIPLLCDFMGYNDEEMHEAIKWKFLKKQSAPFPKFEEIPTVRSTTTLSTVEFEELMSKVRMWASEFGIYIPDPNEIL